jgi:hypothetical protein
MVNRNSTMVLSWWVPALVVICSLFAACGKSYTVENGQVYLSGWNEASGNYQRQIEGADAASFENLEFDCDCSFAFGRDKDHLFIDGNRMEGMDPSSFRFLGNYIFRDARSAYFFGFYNNLNDTRIDSIDPGSITLLEYPWARAGDRLIHGRTSIALDDLENLEFLNGSWARNDRLVLFKTQIVDGADPSTFVATSDSQGHDRSHRYEYGKVVD